MECRVSMVALGVDDLARSRRFYEEGLGWRAGAPSNDAVVFFQAGALVIGLCEREALAKDARWEGGTGEDAPGGAEFSGIALAHNVREKREVAEVIGQAQHAGATVLKPGEDTDWGGHSGYFADPDGHVWEVAWNPHFTLTPEGAMILPG